jgi:lipid A oxidase
MTAGPAPHVQRVIALALTACLVSCLPARADWTLAAYLGTAWTRPATLTVDRGSSGGRTELTGVAFDSRSFEAPPYYGYRVGWFDGRSGIGAEGELIHLKVYARPETLGADVRRLSISHGLDLLLANAVVRRPLPSSHRASATLRLGAGVTVPHAESDIAGVTQEQYEWGSLAVQAAIGTELRVARRARVLAEYKLTTAAPTVGVAGGTIQGRYLSQHLAAGLGVAW